MKSAGPHTVTAACLGAPRVQFMLYQDVKGGTEHKEFVLDCSGSETMVVQLQKGSLRVQLTRNDPDGAWTGAVAGIKITVG